MTKPALHEPLETGVEACTRMGLVAGDILTSKYWDGVPLRIDEIGEKELRVTRLHPIPGNDKWRDGFSHPMRYLPNDVAKMELP